VLGRRRWLVSVLGVVCCYLGVSRVSVLNGSLFLTCNVLGLFELAQRPTYFTARTPYLCKAPDSFLRAESFSTDLVAFPISSTTTSRTHSKTDTRHSLRRKINELISTLRHYNDDKRNTPSTTAAMDELGACDGHCFRRILYFL